MSGHLRTPEGAAVGWRTVAVSAACLLVVGAMTAFASRPPSRKETIVAHAPVAPSALPPTPLIEDARVLLGKKIFFDEKLSVPEGTSCATCHDPRHGYAGNNGSGNGVAQGSRAQHFARRNTPSVLYLRFVPRFRLVWDDESELPEARGGFFWDGRSNRIAELVRQPLLNPDEMNNPNIKRIADTLAKSPYAVELEHEFEGAFESPEKTVEALGFCLEAFLISRPMSPFSSKYDDYVRGQAQLSASEARGLTLFKDPAAGSCGSCHRLDDASPMPEASLFTDYGYDTVAAPRNREIAANRNQARFDLGVCERRDPRLHTEDPWFCGSFRTPSLRNVATRTRFMHNGVFTSLRDVVAFYATRGTDPKRWYGAVPFDDVPERYRRYVNVNTPPYDRGEGETPALADADIDAIVAFLETLTDRDYPAAP
jgi:cytochrome c peroxidase